MLHFRASRKEKVNLGASSRFRFLIGHIFLSKDPPPVVDMVNKRLPPPLCHTMLRHLKDTPVRSLFRPRDAGLFDAKTCPIGNQNHKTEPKFVIFSECGKMQQAHSIFLKSVDLVAFNDAQSVSN